MARQTIQAKDPIADIRAFIASPPECSRVLDFTPDRADAILREFNDSNRPKKPTKIAEYGTDMLEGRFPVTGDTIKFSDHPRLRDGQNRLMASVRYDVPFRSHVVFGIPDWVFPFLDKGRVRNNSDILAIAGYDNTAALAGALRWVHLITEGRAKQRDQIENTELLELVQKRYPKITKHIAPGRAVYTKTAQPISLTIALSYLFTQANPTKGPEFVNAWADGERGGRFNPIKLMQSRIAQLSDAASGRVHDVVRAALVVTAWNLFVQGKKGTMTEMNWRPQEDFPGIMN